MVAAVVTPSAVPTRRARVATPARWQSALKRALDNHLQVFQLASSGQCVVTSASKHGTVYETDGVECSCEAGLNNDPICQHRAMIWYVRGMLDLDPEPEPPAPAAVAVVPVCTLCDGRGRIKEPGFDGVTAVDCWKCHGT